MVLFQRSTLEGGGVQFFFTLSRFFQKVEVRFSANHFFTPFTYLGLTLLPKTKPEISKQPEPKSGRWLSKMG